MNSLHQHNTRITMRLAPHICSILGFLFVGTANANQTPTQSIENQESVPLISRGEADLPSGSIDNPAGIGLILDTIVKYLISILDAPLANQLHFDGHVIPLPETADLLIIGYPFFGLDPNLTVSQIANGLDDAYSLIDILNNFPLDINLDEESQFQLKATAEAIIVELEDGE